MRRASLLVAAVLAALGSWTAAALTAEPRRIHGGGLEATLPAGWHGRVRSVVGSAVLEAATIRLPSGNAATARVARALGGLDAVVSITEVGNRPGTSGFVQLRGRLRIGTDSVRPRPTLGGAPSVVRRFAASGGSFVLVALFGADPPARVTLRQVNGLLVSVRFAGRNVDRRTKEILRRPLRVPPARRTCRRSARARTAARIAWPVGGRPVYVSLGAPGGVAPLEDDIRVRGGYAHKTLWAVAATYRGPLLVRGVRAGTGARIRLGDARPARELWLPAGEGARWRYVPLATVIPAPGCYAFQVDGTAFSRTVVFEARLRRR
jgi:hypothetical protein